MSLIVVEGVDASGKSTLLENARLQIPKRYFILMRHSCRPLKLSDIDGFMDTGAYAERQGLDVIVDRHPLISEPIYGPILRGVNLAAPYTNERIRSILSLYTERIIYCRPPVHMMLENLDKNPQLEWVIPRFQELLAAYDERMDSLKLQGIKVVWYDWTSYKGTLEQLFFGVPGEHA